MSLRITNIIHVRTTRHAYQDTHEFSHQYSVSSSSEGDDLADGGGEIKVESVVLVEEEGKNASSGPAATLTIARRKNTRITSAAAEAKGDDSEDEISV